MSAGGPRAPSTAAGKALVILVLSALPVTGLVMWIGLSGGGRDVQDELHWLGPLPEAPVGAPAPFDTTPPGTRLADARRDHQDLFGLPLGALEDGQHDDVVALGGRSLGRRVRREAGSTVFVFSSGLETVRVVVEPNRGEISRISGSSTVELAVPEAWGPPELVGAGTTSARRVWSRKGLFFSLSDGALQTFALTTTQPEIAPSPTSSAALDAFGAWPERPGLPAGLEALELGGPTRRAQRGLRDLTASIEGATASTTHAAGMTITTVRRPDGSQIAVSAHPAYGVTRLSLDHPSHALAEHLRARWGDGTEPRAGSRTWRDPQARAELTASKNPKGTRVVVAPSWTLDDLLGPEPTRWRAGPRLGETLDALGERVVVQPSPPVAPARPVLVRAPGQAPKLHLPSTPYGLGPVMSPRLEAGRVARLVLDFPGLEDPAAFERALRSLWPGLEVAAVGAEDQVRVLHVPGRPTVAVVIRANPIAGSARLVLPADDWRPYRVMKATGDLQRILHRRRNVR